MAELEPENAYPLVALADLRLMARQTEQAFEFTQEAVRLEDRNVAALAMHARVLDWLGRYDSASDFAFQALELEPDNANVLAILGEIYSDVGNYSVALDYLEEALAVDPDNVMAYRNLGYYHEIQRDYENAIEMYRRAIELAPKRPDLYIELGRQYENQEEWELAISSYVEAVNVGETAFSLDALGWALWQSGDHLQALRVLRRAAEMEPENGLIQAHLGMAYYRRLNYESAAETLEKAMVLLEEDEINAQYTLTLGLSHVYKKPQECDSARHWLQKTLEFAPGLSSALHGLRRCNAG
jgi:superkiller protein 3